MQKDHKCTERGVTVKSEAPVTDTMPSHVKNYIVAGSWLLLAIILGVLDISDFGVGMAIGLFLAWGFVGLYQHLMVRTVEKLKEEKQRIAEVYRL
jgi:uncharacterized membrane protein YciS (DUF1049 family)